jgi:hypothetical protein
MTIRIKKDRIEFDTFTLRETADGFTFDGTITAYQTQPSGFSQGTLHGFFGQGNNNSYERFPFATDGNSTSLGAGNYPTPKSNAASASSATHGYLMSGTQGGGAATSAFKFPFAATDVKTTGINDMLGAVDAGGHQSRSHAYTSGGSATSVYIAKQPFASDSNFLYWTAFTPTLAKTSHASASSDDFGFGFGSDSSGAASASNNWKFPFASDGNAIALTATLATAGLAFNSGTLNSQTHGYVHAGRTSPSVLASNIERFAFASDTPAARVSAIDDRQQTAGASGIAAGYLGGGTNLGGFPYFNTIYKFRFVTDSTSVSIGTMAAGNFGGTGHQSS